MHLQRQSLFAIFAASLLCHPVQAESRALVGYFPSWDSHRLRDTPPAISHVVVSFARPDFRFDGKSFDGTGVQFETSLAALKTEIAALKARNQKVLLAVGGASYNNWAKLAAESNTPGPVTDALKRFVGELGFDGIDVDYEDAGITPAKIAQFRAAITVLRRVAGNGILTLAAWSSGADCIKQTGAKACGGELSWLDNGAGRERLLFADPAVAADIDMLSVMSYDSGHTSYDPVRAFQLYRALLPDRVTVNIGFEIAPEDWGGSILVVKDDDARCKGAMIKADQFGKAVNEPYSIERGLREGPLSGGPKDGVMLWHIFKTKAVPRCGNKKAAAPEDVVRAAQEMLKN